MFTAALSVFCSAHSFAATNDLAALQQPVNEPEWLLKQPSQSFAIQIVTLSSAQQLQDLVDMQLLKGFARFRYKSGGKLTYSEIARTLLTIAYRLSLVAAAH